MYLDGMKAGRQGEVRMRSGVEEGVEWNAYPKDKINCVHMYSE